MTLLAGCARQRRIAGAQNDACQPDQAGTLNRRPACCSASQEKRSNEAHVAGHGTSYPGQGPAGAEIHAEQWGQTNMTTLKA
jgi:hypothetical protein